MNGWLKYKQILNKQDSHNGITLQTCEQYIEWKLPRKTLYRLCVVGLLIEYTATVSSGVVSVYDGTV